MWTVICICILIVIILLGVECIRELKTFQVTHYQITSKKLDNWKTEKRIVLLCDLHNKVYGEDNEVLLDAIRKQNPDLILIAGDMLIGKFWSSPQPAIDFVKQLPEICPVYYGNGNHEQRMKEDPEEYFDAYAKYKKELSRSGVVFLENIKDIIVLDDVLLAISGLEIPMYYYEKFADHVPKLTVVEKLLGEADQSKYQIVISHNPIFLKTLRQWGADLIVSGHLHGGIIRIPGIGGLITPQAKPFPKYSGEMTKVEGTYYVVSRGLGTHTVNIRLFNKAEVVTLHMNGEN